MNCKLIYLLTLWFLFIYNKKKDHHLCSLIISFGLFFYINSILETVLLSALTRSILFDLIRLSQNLREPIPDLARNFCNRSGIN